jgi:hypothetical protein
MQIAATEFRSSFFPIFAIAAALMTCVGCVLVLSQSW